MNICALKPEGWPHLAEMLEHEGWEGGLPKTDQSVILAARNGEKIIGCIGAQQVWIVSPLWIDKEFRGNGLALDMVKELQKVNIQNLDEFLITTSPHVERLVFNLGFRPLLGQLWKREK